MLKEKWSKGKETGCVVSDTPNRHRLSDDHVDYYGGYLVAESIPKQEYVNVISRSLAMLALLEKIFFLVEAEAERRESIGPHEGGYWTEMRDLANEISAEIDKARGKEVKQDG